VNGALEIPHRAKLRRVLAHVDAHLDEALGLDALAAVAGLSRHHFQRTFTGALGMSARDYVRLLRLRRASFQLSFRADLSILEIAVEAGYESGEAFARAFRRVFRLSPTGFRAAPHWDVWHGIYRDVGIVRERVGYRRPRRAGEVRVVTLAPIRLAVIRHDGDPRHFERTLGAFIAWRRRALPGGRRITSYNVLSAERLDVPIVRQPFEIGAKLSGPLPPNDAGVREHVIPRGRHATMRLVGANDAVLPALRHLVDTWLPSSGHRRCGGPAFIHRLRLFPDVPEQETVTDVFLPLE
jgi:AraC family transcriptional regulator